MGLIKPIGSIDRTMTKSGIVRLANDHAHQLIEGGQYDLLKTYVEMKRYELYIRTIIAKLKNISVLQAQVMREDDRNPPPSERPDGSVAAPLALTTPLDADGDLPAESQPMVSNNTIRYATASVQITKRITYDYTQDAEWQRLTSEIARLKVELKQREEYLKQQGEVTAQVSENIAVRL